MRKRVEQKIEQGNKNIRIAITLPMSGEVIQPFFSLMFALLRQIRMKNCFYVEFLGQKIIDSHLLWDLEEYNRIIMIFFPLREITSKRFGSMILFLVFFSSARTHWIVWFTWLIIIIGGETIQFWLTVQWKHFLRMWMLIL